MRMQTLTEMWLCRPYMYAVGALPTDSASRLGVSIRSHKVNPPFHCWIWTEGERKVFNMNSLVDHLEGFSFGRH